MTKSIVDHKDESVNHIADIHKIEPFDFTSGDSEEIAEQFEGMCIRAYGKAVGALINSATHLYNLERWIDENLPGEHRILGKTFEEMYAWIIPETFEKPCRETYEQKHDYAFLAGD